jgi:hypothetical protein
MTRSEIIKEINAIKDNHGHIEKTIDLLYKIQLTKGPLVEAITILKFEKPRLYTTLKTRLGNKTGFKILFEVTVDYEAAKESLGM